MSRVIVPKRLVVGMSGASGAILGIRLLQALKEKEIESHLIISPAARITIQQETDWSLPEIENLASVVYNPEDTSAAIASGSFPNQGMVIIPCSIKTLSAIANCYTADLITRAADVSLKEGRPLILVVREAPLHAGHLRLMQLATSAGAVIFPPLPAFYTRPKNVEEIIDQIVGRVLARLGIENDLYQPWSGIESQSG